MSWLLAGRSEDMLYRDLRPGSGTPLGGHRPGQRSGEAVRFSQAGRLCRFGHVLMFRVMNGYHGAAPPMALSALVAQMARSTNRSTAAAPDPLILLLCVTSLAAPVPLPGACSPARNITNRGVSARPRRPDGRVGGAAS